MWSRNMSAIKQAETVFAALGKKMTNKSHFGPNLNQHGRVVDPGVKKKKNNKILLGLAGFYVIITNSVLNAPYWLFMTLHIQHTLIE